MRSISWIVGGEIEDNIRYTPFPLAFASAMALLRIGVGFLNPTAMMLAHSSFIFPH